MEEQIISNPLDQYAVEEQALLKARSQMPHLSQELPALTTELDSFFNKIRNWMTSAWNALTELLSIKPINFSGLNNLSNILDFVINGLFILIGLALTITIVYSIYRLIKKIDNKTWTFANNFESSFLPREKKLEEEIKKLIHLKDWARASRLRWILFTYRLNFQLSLTPKEYEVAVQPPLPSALEQYQVMYGQYTQEKISDWHFKYDQLLKQIEEKNNRI